MGWWSNDNNFMACKACVGGDAKVVALYTNGCVIGSTNVTVTDQCTPLCYCPTNSSNSASSLLVLIATHIMTRKGTIYILMI